MPFVANTRCIWSQSVLDALLGTLTTVPGAELLTAPEVALYTEAHVADPKNDAPTDFTLAAFDGYAPEAVTLGAGVVNAGTLGRQRYGPADFVMASTDDGTPSIYGWILTSGDGNTLYAQGAFTNPIPLQQAGDFISMDMNAILQFTQNAQ